jgi:hypothetical protein
MIQNGDLKPAENGTATLPPNFTHIADADKIYIHTYIGDSGEKELIVVSQYDHWFPSDTEFLAYDSVDSIIHMYQKCNPQSYVHRIEPNWFIYR